MRWLALLGALVLAGCTTDLGPSRRTCGRNGTRRMSFRTTTRTTCWRSCAPISTIPSISAAPAVAPPQLKKVGPGQRYVACVRYNARDNNGHYAGPQDGAAIYVSGKLDHFVDQPKAVKELCKDAAYAPFPALEKLTR